MRGGGWGGDACTLANPQRRVKMRSDQAGLTTSQAKTGNAEGPRAQARTPLEFVDARIVPAPTGAHFLGDRHYLGPPGRGPAWSDEYGVLVLAKPTARMRPQDGSWRELVRWCLLGERNGGSRQW